MTHIISIANHKGGVGKTSSTQNIGAGLAREGKKVLLLDIDPQANLSDSAGLGEAEVSIYDLMADKTDQIPLYQINENLHIIPANLDLSVAEVEFSGRTSREKILLKKVVQPIGNNYDYILIDCPPSLGLLTINALTASTEVYIPLDAEYFSMKGLDKLMYIIDLIKEDLNPQLNVSGVFVTKFDSRMVLKNNVLELIKEDFGDRVFKTRIRTNIAIAEAQAQSLDIFAYNPSCNGAVDYAALTKEIIQSHESIPAT